MRFLWIGLVLLISLGCSSTPSEEKEKGKSPAAAASPQTPTKPPTTTDSVEAAKKLELRLCYLNLKIESYSRRLKEITQDGHPQEEKRADAIALLKSMEKAMAEIIQISQQQAEVYKGLADEQEAWNAKIDPKDEAENPGFIAAIKRNNDDLAMLSRLLEKMSRAAAGEMSHSIEKIKAVREDLEKSQ